MGDSVAPFSILLTGREEQPRMEPYTDFVVSTSDDDQYFIVRRPNIGRNEEPDGLRISVDTNDSTNSTEIPDFSFLGALHEKLKQISNLALSDHITKCQQESEEQSGRTSGLRMPMNADEIRTIRLQSMFFSAVSPAISNARYMQYLVRYFCLPSYVYVVAFIYLDRLGSSQTLSSSGLLRLTPENTHRIIITTCFIAARILTPSLTHVNLAHFSRVGGASSADELRNLVVAFCQVIGQDFQVAKNEFKAMLEKL